MDNVITAQSVIVASSEQISCDLEGEAVILNLQDGVYYGLDEVGARVWSLIQTPMTVDALRDTILQEYDVDASQCDSDLLALLRDLIDHKLVEVRDAVGA